MAEGSLSRHSWSQPRKSVRSQFRSPFPFKCVSPAQFGTTSLAASSYPSSPNNRNIEFDLLGKTGRTVREYDKELEDLRKENFSLKLRIYLLEQRFSEAVGHDVAETVQANVQLHIQLEALQNEIKCKNRVLEETRKTAQQNETAYRKAKEKIATLEKQINNLKEEMQQREERCSTPTKSKTNEEAFKDAFGLWTPQECKEAKFSTPKKPRTTEEAFKEAYGLYTPKESWVLQSTPSSLRFSDGDGENIDDLRNKIADLQRTMIAKELEIEQSKAIIRQLQENTDALQMHSKKKSKVIQSLVHKLGKLPDIGSREMLEAVNRGLEAAKDKNISQVLHYVNKIKLHFCELVSMTPEDLFQEHCANAAELKNSFVVKDKRIQELESIIEDQKELSQINTTDCEHFLKELETMQRKTTELQGALSSKTSALTSIEKSKRDLEVEIIEKTSEMKKLQSCNQGLQQELNFLRNQLVNCGDSLIEKMSKKEDSIQKVQSQVNQSNTTDSENLKKQLEEMQCKNSELQAALTARRTALDCSEKARDDLAHELEEKVSEMMKLHSCNQTLQQQVDSLKCEMQRLREAGSKESEKEKSKVMVSSSAIQTEISATVLEAELWENMMSKVGSSDSAGALKEEIFVLLLKLEQRDRDIKSLKEEIGDLQRQVEEVVLQKSVVTSQVRQLQQHLEKLAAFMDNLIHNRLQLSNSPLTPDIMEEASRYLEETLHLSNDLSGNLSIWEQSCISHRDSSVFAPSINIESSRYSLSPPKAKRHTLGGDVLHEGVETLPRGLYQRSGLREKNFIDRVERQLSVIESQQKKVEEFTKHFERLTAHIKNVIPTKGAVPFEGAKVVEGIYSEIGIFKEVLIEAVHELQKLKDAFHTSNSVMCSETAIQELKEYMANILKTLVDEEGEGRVTAIQAKKIAETALLELDSFKKQLATVCSALVAEDGSAGEALPKMLPPVDSLQHPENVHATGDVESLRLLIVKQRTENIKLKQALSQLIEQKKVLENEINKINLSKQNVEAERENTAKENECQTDESTNEDVMSFCERLKSELETTHNKLKLLESKYRSLENECKQIREEKSCICLENKELKEKVKSLNDHVQALSDKCSGIEKQSTERIHSLQKSLSEKENNIKCLEAKTTQCQTELHHSEEIRQILECELNETRKKLENMSKKCLQYEEMLENRFDHKKSSGSGNFKSTESMEMLRLQISDLNQKFSVADELLKQKMSDCCSLKEENTSLSSSLEEVNAKSNEMQLLIDDLMKELKNKDAKITGLHECMKNMESSLLEKETLIRNSVHELEMLQTCIPMFPKGNQNAGKDPSQSRSLKDASDISGVIKKLQHSIHQANIARNFINVVKSAVIANLRKKVEDKEEDLKAIECQLKGYNGLNFSSGFTSQTSLADHKSKAVSRVSQLTDEGIAEYSHTTQSMNILHTNECEGDEIRSSLTNRKSPGDSSFIGKPNHRLDSTKGAELLQEELKEMEYKILELEDQLKVKDLAMNTYEKEKELLRAHIRKEAEQRSRTESYCEQLKTETARLQSDLTQLQEQNSHLKEHSAETKAIVKEIEKERMLLVKQLKEKSECNEKFKENIEQAIKKINDLESICAEHSELHAKFEVELTNKKSEIDKLSNDLKQKKDRIIELENDKGERDRVLQELDECLRRKSSDFSALELELKNAKNAIESLQKDLQYKSARELDLEKEIKMLTVSIGDKSNAIDHYQKAMSEKDAFISSLKGNLLEKENFIKDLNSQLQNAKSQSNALEAGLTEKEKSIEELKGNLEEKSNQIHQLHLNVQDKVKLIEDLQNELHARCNEAASEVRKRDTFMQEMKGKLAEVSQNFHEKMVTSEKQKEARIQELQSELKNWSVMVENLKATTANKDKETVQLKNNLSESLSIVSKLQEDLKHKSLLIEKLKSSLDEKCSLVKSLEHERVEFVKVINRIESDLDRKAAEVQARDEMSSKLESEYKTNVAILEQKIGDLERQVSEYRSKISEEFVPSFESVVPKSNSKNKKHESRQQSIATSYELKAVLPAEKESCASMEGDWSLQKESMHVVLTNKTHPSVKDSERNDLQRKLKATELSLKECKREKAKLEIKLQKLADSHRKLMKDASAPGKLLESELALQDSDTLCHLHTRKWSLQSEILKLQAEIFKDSPPNLEKHTNFIKKMKELHSQACSTRWSDITQEYSLRLELDLEFLENIKLLLMHFVIPLLKETLNSETTSCKSEVFDLLGAQHKRYQTVNRNLKNQSVKDGHPVQSALSKGIDGSDKESAVSSDNGIPMSRTESQSSFDSRFSGDSSHRRALEELCHNYLTGGQISKGGDDDDDTKIPDAMHLRSNYSSPDLGIESDPNQEVPAADGFGSQNYLPNALSTESMAAKVLERGPSSGDASLYAIGILQDFELLKKEIQECRIEMKSISSRAADGLQHIAKNTTPKKLLEHATLKGILDGCNCIEVCLSQAERLTNKFNIISSPISESADSLVSLVMENQDLKGKLDELQSKIELQEQKYFSTVDQLKHEKKKKEKMDRLIAKQLVETKNVLRKTKANLLGRSEVDMCPKSSS